MEWYEDPVAGDLVVLRTGNRILDVKAAERGPGRYRRLSFFVPPGNVQIGDEIHLIVDGSGLQVIYAEVVALISPAQEDEGEHYDAKVFGGCITTDPGPKLQRPKTEG